MSNDQETVVIGRQKTRHGTYHTTECNTYPDNPREISIGEARRRGLRECDVCQGNVTHSDQPSEPLASRLEDMDPSDL